MACQLAVLLRWWRRTSCFDRSGRRRLCPHNGCVVGRNLRGRTRHDAKVEPSIIFRTIKLGPGVELLVERLQHLDLIYLVGAI